MIKFDQICRHFLIRHLARLGETKPLFGIVDELMPRNELLLAMHPGQVCPQVEGLEHCRWKIVDQLVIPSIVCARCKNNFAENFLLCTCSGLNSKSIWSHPLGRLGLDFGMNDNYFPNKYGSAGLYYWLGSLPPNKKSTGIPNHGQRLPVMGHNGCPINRFFAIVLETMMIEY